MNDIEFEILLQERPVRIGILLFPDVEVLDFAGPFEVFSVASRLYQREKGRASFDVSTIAAQKEVMARHGLKVMPHCDFNDARELDLLIVPGGVMDQPLSDEKTLTWVRVKSDQALITASVCTGAFVLAQLGKLDGLRVTTHWEDIPELREKFPKLNVLEGVPFVDEGTIITSAGISAGIEMSLHLVGRILGKDMAVRTARQMSYHWLPTSS